MAKKGRRLSEASLNESDDARHSRESGQSRKGLFAKRSEFGAPNGNVADAKEVRILQDFKRRGPNGSELWYLELANHFFKMVSEDGTREFNAGKICWRHLREIQPGFLAEIIQVSDYMDRDCRCFVCEVMEALKTGEDEWHPDVPLRPNKYGPDRPPFNEVLNYGFPILYRQGDYADGDDNIVKIGLGTSTMVRGIDKQMRKEGYYPDLTDHKLGNWVKFAIQGRSWGVTVNPKGGPIWFSDVDQVLHDGWLEEKMPNLRDWSYDEQRDHFRDHFPDVYALMDPPKKTKPKATRKKGKK